MTQPKKAPPTYYGRPMIKRPTWSWFIPLYFFLGGIAGGAAAIGAAADLVGGRRHRATVRRARYLSVVLAAICPPLLVVDLGRPARFHHMLRVFKLSSPLSVGTWILSGFGLASGALAARQALDDGLLPRQENLLPARLLCRVPMAPLSALHGLLGLGLGGYTGVLLTATAVPLWAAAGLLLGPLFLCTALASGGAALTLLGALSRSRSVQARREIATVESTAAVAQLGLALAREVLVPPEIARPLRRGVWGPVWRLGAVGGGMSTPLALRLAMRLSGRRIGPALDATLAALTLAGALTERFALIEAGKLSADDPRAYQALTRGAPGEARPTPQQQAARAGSVPAYQPHLVAPEVTG